MTETSIAPTNAAVKVVTVNPRMTFPKYQNNRPFTTRENNPRVTIFIGRVNTFIIGLINILNSVKHAPTISATYSGFTLIPEII